MENRPHLNLWKVYRQMGAFVGSRNYRQCKAHHQRNLRDHETIDNIIEAMVLAYENFQNYLEV